MRSLVLFSLLVSNLAFANTPFSLSKKGDQVCRTREGQPEQCLPGINSLGLGVHVNDRIELIDQLKAKTGGWFLLTEAETAAALKNYRRLSVRNLAVGSALAFERDEIVHVPFFASVYWKGTLLTEGTLHVEGYIRYRRGQDKNQIPEKANDYRAAFRRALKIDNFSDSTTEQKIEILRNLETTARYIHFTRIGTNGKSVDEATLDLLQETVAPMLFGEIIVFPALKNAFDGLEETLKGLR